MEVHSHGLETLGVNKDADKIYNPELKDILAPPSSQIPAGENFTVPPSAHSNDVHGKEEVTNNAIGSDPGAAPTATFSFPPAPSDLNNTPSDINFQPYEAVVIEQNSQHDAHQVCEQDEAFDDMVMLEDGMVTSASLSGGGADTFQETDIQMEDFQPADIFNPTSVASDVPIEMSAGEKPEIPSSVADVGASVTVVTETTVVSEVVAEELLTTELTTAEVPCDFPVAADPSGVLVDSGKEGDGEQVPTADVAETKVPEVSDPAEVVNPAGPDADAVQKSEPGAGSHEVTEEDIKAIKGQKVVKKFGKKKYGGEVTDFDPETKWFKVVYEDGDDEDLELWEVKLILASSLSSPSSSKKRSRTESGADESSQKSSKKPKKSGNSTAKKSKSGSKSSAKSPKTPGSKAKGSRGAKKSSVSSKGRSPGKLIKKALEGSAFKTPADPQIKEGKGKGKSETSTPSSNKGGSSKKRKTVKVSRTLNLQSPKTQTKGKTKVDAENSGSKKAAKSPKQPTSGLKRKAVGGETTAERSKRSRKGVTEPEEASKGGVSSLLGKHVKKDFGGTIYGGVVVKHDKKTGFYKVKYDDGDQEDLEMHELELILVKEAGSAEEKEGKPAKLSSLSSLMSEEKKAGAQKRK